MKCLDMHYVFNVYWEVAYYSKGRLDLVALHGSSLHVYVIYPPGSIDKATQVMYANSVTWCSIWYMVCVKKHSILSNAEVKFYCEKKTLQIGQSCLKLSRHIHNCVKMTDIEIIPQNKFWLNLLQNFEMNL